MTLRARILAFAAALAFSPGFAAHAADTYPSKPIHVVVPFPPGGPVDTLARLLSAKMADAMGQQLVVENKPGAGGSIGAAQVARSSADGYTVLMTASSFAMDPAIRSNLPFDPRKDMHGVSMVASGPVVLLARQGLPAKNVSELLALIKQNPDKYSYASTGVGTVNHFAGELFKGATQTSILHVPYNGAAPATQAILAGEVDIFFNNVLSSLPHIKAGKVQALAVTSEERWPSLPDVPTLTESNVDVQISSWYGFLAPGATPPAVMDKFASEVKKALADPETREKIAQLGLAVDGTTPDEFQAYIGTEIDKWTGVAKKADIKAQ